MLLHIVKRGTVLQCRNTGKRGALHSPAKQLLDRLQQAAGQPCARQPTAIELTGMWAVKSEHRGRWERVQPLSEVGNSWLGCPEPRRAHKQLQTHLSGSGPVTTRASSSAVGGSGRLVLGIAPSPRPAGVKPASLALLDCLPASGAGESP